MLLTYNCHDAYVITLPAELDACATKDINNEVATCISSVVFDCKKLQFMDVAGFRFLLNVQKNLNQRGNELILINLNELCLQLLAHFQAGRLMKTYNNLDDYVESNVS